MAPQKKKDEKILNFAIPEAMHRRLRIQAAYEGITIKDMIFKALEDYYKKHPVTFDSKEKPAK